jgi:hypothetical protein
MNGVNNTEVCSPNSRSIGKGKTDDPPLPFDHEQDEKAGVDVE